MIREFSIAVASFVVAGGFIAAAVIVHQEPIETSPGIPTQELIEDPISYFGPQTKINGERPPGEPALLEDVTIMLDTVNADGNRVLITQGIRKAGTRVGIHVHQFGGQTCVLSGENTDFIEGQAPMVFPAGTCYYMPPNTIMAAANLGGEDAVLIDVFVFPPGTELIDILDPEWPDGLEPAYEF